jgi:hypothetical protein
MTLLLQKENRQFTDQPRGQFTKRQRTRKSGFQNKILHFESVGLRAHVPWLHFFVQTQADHHSLAVIN